MVEPAHKWKSGRVGPDGRPLTSEEEQILYELLDLDDRMLELGKKCRMGEAYLLARAREFHSVYPTEWRELFIADLQRRARGELYLYEKVDLGIVPSTSRQVEILDERLRALLDELKPEERIVAYEELVFHMTQRKEKNHD